MTDPQWQHSTVLCGDPVDEVRRLKGSGGGDLMVAGSIMLAHAVLAAGLVEEIRLFVYPAVQGRGRGLVAEGTALPHLELRELKSFRSGVVLLRYAVVGG
jgi:dihydrofolate reductase